MQPIVSVLGLSDKSSAGFDRGKVHVNVGVTDVFSQPLCIT